MTRGPVIAVSEKAAHKLIGNGHIVGNRLKFSDGTLGYELAVYDTDGHIWPFAIWRSNVEKMAKGEL